MTRKQNRIRPKHRRNETQKAQEKKGEGEGAGRRTGEEERFGGGGFSERTEGEANSSRTETFSRMKGDLSHKSTYKRKLSRITMISKC